MRKTLFFIRMLLFISIIFGLQVYADQPSQTQNKPAVPSDAVPAAVAAQSLFQFAPVVEGTVITHDFIIENTGRAPLIIEGIRTSCGCTTASYTKTIAPGAQGKISIRGNTRGYSGKTFSKTILVRTNDPGQKELRFHISGKVEPFAQIWPGTVHLQGDAGGLIESVVTITPLKKYPFDITGVSIKNLDGKISVNVEKTGNSYQLKIKNLQKEPGTYYGRIQVRTDSPAKPEMTIYVYGMINDKKPEPVRQEG